MKKIFVSLVSVSLFVSLVILGIAGPLSAQSGNVKELKFSTYTPPTHHVSKAMTQFCKDIEEATGGQIKVILYPSGTLTKSEQVLDGVIKGISDFGYTCVSYNPGRLPLFDAFDLPIPVDTCEKMSTVMLAAFKKFQPQEFSQLKVLGFLNMAASGISSNKPINKFADLKGQSIRCTPGDVSMIKALGATPVAMPMPQAYEALQRGVADGNTADYASYLTYKLGEVCKIHVDFFFRNTGAYFGMNLKTYNSLTPAQQKIITDLGEKYTTIMGKDRDAENKKGRDYLVGLGNKFVKLPVEEEQKWTAALAPVYDDFIKTRSAKGLPAKEMVDFIMAAVK
jgi:TRAP-type C4-dicarboxylate transport system substrate-binding protein